MRIYLMGRHAHRIPFAYSSYREIFRSCFEYVEDPKEADVIVFGYVLNIDENAEHLSILLKNRPDLRLVVVSEEPLWDTTNSGDFFKRHNIRKTSAGEFSYSVINHHTSNVYKFKKFPYFITTDDKFYLRYSRAFACNASTSLKKLLSIWQNAKTPYAFFAEKRELTKKYSVSWPEAETWGLSVYRTDFAKKMPSKDTLKIGRGWGSAIVRQELPDWHLDKLVTLSGNSMIVSAIENTSQPNYITEKIFDSFAVEGIPLYWASPTHRVSELVPEKSFLNVFGLEPDDAVQKITNFRPDAIFAEEYIEAQGVLSERFRYYDDYIDERFDFAERLTSELCLIIAE